MKQPNKLYILFVAFACSLSTISYGKDGAVSESKTSQALVKAKETIAKTGQLMAKVPGACKQALQSKSTKDVGKVAY